MIISAYNSQKIKILSFISIILVLYIHSNFIESNEYTTTIMIQMFTGTFGLSLVAVPLFYFISGILFFKSVFCYRDCIDNIMKRVKTLFVPFVIWNVVFVLWYFVLSKIPGASSYVIGGIQDKIISGSFLSRLYLFFVLPAGFHLWFIRDLLLFTTLTPLLLVMIKKHPWFVITLSYVISCFFLRCGLCYFIIGGCIAYHNKLDAFDFVIKRKITIVCALFYFLNCMATANISPYPFFLMGPIFQQIIGVIAIIAVWGGYNLFVPEKLNISEKWNKILSYTFFIYLFHEPVLNILKKASLKIIGINEISLILIYLLLPFVMVAIAVTFGFFLNKISPKLYSISVGGR